LLPFAASQNLSDFREHYDFVYYWIMSDKVNRRKNVYVFITLSSWFYIIVSDLYIYIWTINVFMSSSRCHYSFRPNQSYHRPFWALDRPQNSCPQIAILIFSDRC
jgi:hypothetical protein